MKEKFNSVPNHCKLETSFLKPQLKVFDIQIHKRGSRKEVKGVRAKLVLELSNETRSKFYMDYLIFRLLNKKMENPVR